MSLHLTNNVKEPTRFLSRFLVRAPVDRLREARCKVRPGGPSLLLILKELCLPGVPNGERLLSAPLEGLYIGATYELKCHRKIFFGLADPCQARTGIWELPM